MINETCAVCMHPKRILVENLLLSGNPSPRFVARSLMLNDNVYLEETDIMYHIDHCMEAVTTLTSARKTIRDMKDNAVALRAAKDAYSKAAQVHSCVPPGEVDVEAAKAEDIANRKYIDLKRCGIELSTHYDLQVKAIDGAKRLRTVLRNNAAADAKMKATRETQRLALEYQAAQQPKAEAEAGV